jgi:hypothetical protein
MVYGLGIEKLLGKSAGVEESVILLWLISFNTSSSEGCGEIKTYCLSALLYW